MDHNFIYRGFLIGSYVGGLSGKTFYAIDDQNDEISNGHRTRRGAMRRIDRIWRDESQGEYTMYQEGGRPERGWAVREYHAICCEELIQDLDEKSDPQPIITKHCEENGLNPNRFDFVFDPDDGVFCVGIREEI